MSTKKAKTPTKAATETSVAAQVAAPSVAPVVDAPAKTPDEAKAAAVVEKVAEKIVKEALVEASKKVADVKKPKPVEEDRTVAKLDIDYDVEQEKKKVKKSLLIIDDEVVELKPVGQLAGLLGFVGVHGSGFNIDEAKHVILNDVLFVFAEGSSLTVTDVRIDERTVRHAKPGDFSVGALPVVVLINSKLTSTYWVQATGKNILVGSSLNGGGQSFSDTTLHDTTLIDVTIRAGHIALTRSRLTGSRVDAKDVRLTATSMSSFHVTTKGKVVVNKLNANKPLNIYGYTDVEINPNHDLYQPDFNITGVYSPKVENKNIGLSLISRVDYGHFNALKPLSFVRVNLSDMVVEGVFLENDQFEEVFKRYSNDLGHGTGGNYFNGVVGHQNCACLSDEEYLLIVRALYGLAMGTHNTSYTPDRSNTLENGIIMNLLEQIRSRMNLYRQVSAVVK